jgi:putative FmdB family regulatory protein
MPIYEYICENCGVKNSFLVFPWENEVLKCKKCGGEKLKRIISRFARLRSDEERMESTVDEAMRSVDINNPESIKKWMQKTLKEYSSELDSDVDIEEAVESLSEEIGLSGKKEEEEGEESKGELGESIE